MRLAPTLAAFAALAFAVSAHAATPPNLVGTWTPTADSVGVTVGKDAPNGWKITEQPNLKTGNRPSFVIDKQEGRAVSGYMLNPDGTHQVFVGVIKRSGKQLVGSNDSGVITADLNGNEMEECWMDTLPGLTGAACNTLRRSK